MIACLVNLNPKNNDHISPLVCAIDQLNMAYLLDPRGTVACILTAR
jgi:hypothetical protein